MGLFAPSRIVTLLTDFGLQDSYVGQMKGVILGVDPSLRIVDLTHGISPQDIDEGAFQLHSVIGTFGAGAVHVAVVDPGVGTARKALVVEALGQLWVGPDNGLLSHLYPEASKAYLIENSCLLRPTVSATFHGRDLFAPVGALLASGRINACDVGRPAPIRDLVRLPECVSVSSNGVRGRIVSIDRFGNCITLISAADIGDQADVELITCGDFRVETLDRTFGNVPEAAPVAYIGSSATLELAVRDGDAAKEYGLKRGDWVSVLVR